MTSAHVFWTFLFGSVGFAFFIYGKKQQRAVPLVCGVALMLFPYFVSSTLGLVITGLLLCVLPLLYRP